MTRQKSWKTTLLGIAAAIVGGLSADASPAPKEWKQVAQVAGWVLVGLTGKAAADHRED